MEVTKNTYCSYDGSQPGDVARRLCYLGSEVEHEMSLVFLDLTSCAFFEDKLLLEEKRRKQGNFLRPIDFATLL